MKCRILSGPNSRNSLHWALIISAINPAPEDQTPTPPPHGDDIMLQRAIFHAREIFPSSRRTEGIPVVMATALNYATEWAGVIPPCQGKETENPIPSLCTSVMAPRHETQNSVRNAAREFSRLSPGCLAT